MTAESWLNLQNCSTRYPDGAAPPIPASFVVLSFFPGRLSTRTSFSSVECEISCCYISSLLGYLPSRHTTIITTAGFKTGTSFGIYFSVRIFRTGAAGGGGLC